MKEQVTEPLISCVVPVYNGERYLGETLDSVLGQTWARVEVIVVDDGSTDRSAQVATSYSERVRLIRQPNAGPSVARNTGVAAARGDLIAFSDADDLWSPEKLELQQAFMREGPLDGSFTHIENFWIEALREEAERMQGTRAARVVPGYVSSTMMISRTAFDVVGPFNPALGHREVQDWVLRARELKLSIGLMPDILTHRRLHHDNRSRHHAAPSIQETLDLIKAQLNRHRAQ